MQQAYRRLLGVMGSAASGVLPQSTVMCSGSCLPPRYGEAQAWEPPFSCRIAGAGKECEVLATLDPDGKLACYRYPTLKPQIEARGCLRAQFVHSPTQTITPRRSARQRRR